MSERYFAEKQKFIGCGGKKALVVGVDEYQVFSQLNLAVLDAQHAHNALKMANFQVAPVVRNPNRQELWNAIEEFAQKLEHGDIALFYFAGHGSEHNSVNYLYGIDGRIDVYKGNSYPFGLELNRHVMSLLSSKEPNCYFLIIIDACRTELQTFEAGRSRGQEAVPGSMVFPSQVGFDEYDIVYACQPGSQSLEPGQKGCKKPAYLAQAIYSCIMEDGSWGEVITNIKAKVTNLSGGRQKPQNLNNLLATLYLQPTQKYYKSIRAADLNTHKKNQYTQTDKIFQFKQQQQQQQFSMLQKSEKLEIWSFWNQNYLDSTNFRLLVIFLALTAQSIFQSSHLTLLSFFSVFISFFISFKKIFVGENWVRLFWGFLMILVILSCVLNFQEEYVQIKQIQIMDNQVIKVTLDNYIQLFFNKFEEIKRIHYQKHLWTFVNVFSFSYLLSLDDKFGFSWTRTALSGLSLALSIVLIFFLFVFVSVFLIEYLQLPKSEYVFCVELLAHLILFRLILFFLNLHFQYLFPNIGVFFVEVVMQLLVSGLGLAVFLGIQDEFFNWVLNGCFLFIFFLFFLIVGIYDILLSLSLICSWFVAFVY